MPSDRGPKQNAVVVISAVEINGVLIETVFRPESRDTALVVARESGTEVVKEWKNGKQALVPVGAGNNLIKHRALLLPSAPIEYQDTASLLNEICSYIGCYVSLSDSATTLSAAYVLLSWVYDAFNELPYLRFRGDYGTGKTRALLVIGSICYKAFLASGASTVSPIFHTLDTFKGTLIFDEADFRFTDEKAELVKILNNGNVRGFPVLRTQVTQKREFDPRAFAIFGPKIVGMRRSYEDRALESRFLTIEMEPGQAGVTPINLPDIQQSEALELRNKLLTYRLRNRLSLRLDASLADPSLEPRMNQILLPLLSVLPARMRSVISETARSQQASIVADRSDSTEGRVIAILNRLRVEGTVSVGDVATAFMVEHGSDYERAISNRWIGSILRRLNIVLYKSNGVFVLVPGQDKRIAALAERFGVSPPCPNENATPG